MKKHIIYDDDSEVVLCKTYEVFAQLFDSAIQQNGEGEILLKKSGLSSLCEEYGSMLTPYTYNGQWQNPNVQYNPQMVFFELYPDLDEKHQFMFLKNIVENANFRKFGTKRVENYLSLLGYSLVYDSDYRSDYTLKQATRGIAERSNDITLLEEQLQNDYPEVFHAYDEALSTFGNCEYKSCIDNCRTVFEKITEALSGSNNDRAILALTKECVKDENNNDLTNKQKIYEYWLKNKKGANRYRYFTTLYSVMSGLGTHGEAAPTKADAVLIMRAIEDVLVWLLNI